MTSCGCVIRPIFIVIALAGCTENDAVSTPPETPPVGTERAIVTGRVVDAEGAGIAGATLIVRATGERATSDDSGAFVIDVPANTTLTLAATAPDMAPTLLQQFMLSPEGGAEFKIPLLTSARLASLSAMGANPKGGVV